MVPASIRYRNPGAMWGGNAISRKWGATANVALADGTGQGNTIAVFPTFVAGICAQIDLWRSKRYRGQRFDAAIRVWSGGNHVESYIAFVLARVPGMTRGTVIDDAFLASETGRKFLQAQAWHEAGRRYPAPEADWIEAQRIVFAGARKEKIAKAVIATSAVAPIGTAAAVADHGHQGWVGLVVGLVIIAACAAAYMAWRWSRPTVPPAEPPAGEFGDPI